MKIGGEGTRENRSELFDEAMRLGAPAEGWMRCKRSSKGAFRLWKLDVSELSAPEAAAVTVPLAAYLGSLASPFSHRA